MSKTYIFTSESVTEGHPDKVSDHISDAILDEFLRQDPDSRVAVETLVTTDFVAVAGEVTSKGKFDIEKVVRDTIAEIGYDDPVLKFDAKTCESYCENRSTEPKYFSRSNDITNTKGTRCRRPRIDVWICNK